MKKYCLYVNFSDTKRHLVDKLHGETKSSINKLQEVSRSSLEYATDITISNAKTNLSILERPRKIVSTNLLSSINESLAVIDEGEGNIKEVLQQQCSTTDELRQDIEEKHTRYESVQAEERRKEIEENRVFINKTVDKHTESSIEVLKELSIGTDSTKERVDTFSKDVIQFKDEVPPVLERKTYPYTSKLSSTPAKEEIYKAVNLV